MLILFISKIRDPIIDTTWSQVGEQIVYKSIEQITTVGGPIWNAGGYQLYEYIIDLLRQHKQITSKKKPVNKKKFAIEHVKTITIYFAWNEMIWQIWLMIWTQCSSSCYSDKTLELVFRIGFEWLVYVSVFPQLQKCYSVIKKEMKKRNGVK